MVVNDRRLECEQDENNLKLVVYSIKKNCLPCCLIKLGRSAPTENWEVLQELTDFKTFDSQRIEFRNAFTMDGDNTIVVLETEAVVYDTHMKQLARIHRSEISPFIDWIAVFVDEFTEDNTTNGFLVASSLPEDDEDSSQADTIPTVPSCN